VLIAGGCINKAYRRGKVYRSEQGRKKNAPWANAQRVKVEGRGRGVKKKRKG